MAQIWLVIAFGPLILFWLLAATSDDLIRLAAMRAIAWFAAMSLFGGEALGAFGAISANAVRIYWLGITVLLTTLVVFRLRYGHPIRIRPLRLRCYAPYGPWIVVILTITLLIAATGVPNNGDALAYHLPKVEHWLQNGTLAFYPTHDDRQNDLGPLAEVVILQWRAITGGDNLSPFLQWLAMAGSLMGVSLITARLGGRTRAQLLAVLFCASLPMGILQSTTNQNDYVTAFFLICFIERIIAARETYRPTTVIEGALSIAFAVLTKPTALIWGLPFGIWFAAPLIRRPRKAVAVLGLFAIVAVMPCVGHYGRLVAAYGTPVAPLSKLTNSASFGFGQTLDSFFLHSASELAVPVDRINALILRTVDQASATLGFSLHRADTVIDDDSVLIPELCRLCRQAQDTTSPKLSVRLPDASRLLNEDEASNPLHFGIAFASLAIALVWLIRRQRYPLGWYAFCCIASYLLFVSLIRWQIHITRLHLPLLVAVSPAVGMVGSEVRRFRPVVEFLALVLCVSSWPFLARSDLRPLWPHSYLTEDRSVTLFAGRPALREPYTAIVEHVRQTGCHSIGLIAVANFYEFPFWFMLRGVLEKGGRLEHVFPEQLAVAYPLGPFHPLCIIVDHEASLPAFVYDGRHWREAYRAGPVALYERSADN